MSLLPACSIIVVSHNTKMMTLECLRSIYAQTTVNFELIVVDNASSDGSAEAIASDFPDAILLAEDVNHGFAKANNMAAKRASAAKLLLLNPDTVVCDHAIDRLLRFSELKPKARIWGGRTLFGDMSLNPYSCWQRITLWNLFCRTSGLASIFKQSALLNPEAYGGWDRSYARAVDIVTGCLFMISKADWDDLGGFDPTFFMYGEEADLCLRARRQLGADPHITPDATIIHYGGASEKVRADKMVRVNRAKVELIKRHIPVWQQPLALLLYLSWPLSRRIILEVLRRPSAGDWAEIWKRRGEWRHGFN